MTVADDARRRALEALAQDSPAAQAELKDFERAMAHMPSISGQPIPKDMEPEEPKPDDVQPT